MMNNKLNEKLTELLDKLKDKSKEINQCLTHSLITGKLEPNQLLIIGINWGGNNKECKSQTNIYDCYREQGLQNAHKKDFGSLAKFISDISELEKEAALIKHASQTNYCFFRTPKEKDLPDSIYDECRPILVDLIKAMKPSMVLCCVSKLRDDFKNRKFGEDIPFTCKDEKDFGKTRKFKARHGTIMVNSTSTPIGFLPHPMSRLSGKPEALKYIFEALRSH